MKSFFSTSTINRLAASGTNPKYLVSSTPKSLVVDHLRAHFAPALQVRTFFGSASKKPNDGTISEQEVRNLFGLWNDSLATLDSTTVAKRYSSNPILLPTVSDTPRKDFATIKDYFDNFLKMKPQGKILDSKVIVGEDWAMDAGIYEFTMGATGAVVKARYSYVYVNEDDGWKIAHHHSSVMPEGIPKGPQPISKEEVQSLFYKWNSALKTLDSTTVAKCYAKNAVLLPTVSDQARTSYDTIKEYFDNFLKIKPQGVILESNVHIGHDWAQDAGIYEFTLTNPDGSTKQVKARYSFIYVHEDGEWKIQHHHSSVMPEGIPAAPQPITEQEVRSLFNVWNDALATLDPDTVTKCYSSKPVLLPTVSNVPRTDYATIKDYFTAFLQRKPQGKIVSGDITIGHNWAQDAGIYDFTMGATGDQVRARYSFVYVFENGAWKISHHHSSVLPEGQA
jgi:uncharacterized protein (TIGR02246 family)